MLLSTFFIKHFTILSFYSFYKKSLYFRVINNSLIKDIIQNEFHKLYYYSEKRTWRNTYWLNIPTLKCPTDLWVYQEIITETKPDIIVETGTARGGSALFFTIVCEAVKKGRVVTIDVIREKNLPRHPRLTYLYGSSTSEKLILKLKKLIRKKDRVMVVLDSDHHKNHVLDELRIYSKLVTRGCYLVVEDTHLHGHPVKPHFPPNPMEAVKEFLNNNSSFVIDQSREKFYLTFYPNGFLLKVK